MRGLLRRHGNLQRLRIGESDVFGRRDDQAARDEQWILAGLQHPRQPVHGSIRIAAAHAFDQRGDDVVVLVAGAVVEEVSFLESSLDMVRPDFVTAGERSCRLDRKSTRLNSSHSSISYAVFCLKKKKK